MNQEELAQVSELLKKLIGDIDYGTIRLLSIRNTEEEVLSIEKDTFKNNYGKPIFIKKPKEELESLRLDLKKDIPSQLEEYQSFFKDNANLYFTPNIFKYRGKESQDNVNYLTTLFVDIDNGSAEEGLARLKNSQLPKPSYAISSGHGVHFYWILNYKLPAEESYIKSWLKVQKFISSQLNSDTAVNEISRYLRVPLSTNNKKGKPIKTKILINNLAKSYDFRDDFYNKFCKSKKKYDPNKYTKKSSEGSKNATKDKKKHHNNYAQFLRQDIEKVINNRKESGYKWEGLRNNTLYTLKCLKYSKEYLEYVNNEIFNEPLSSTEFSHIVNSKQSYHYIKREKIFNNLKITSEEEKDLKVLINEADAVCRKRLKELEVKYNQLIKESLQYIKINYVITANKTNKEVAKNMKISEREVGRSKNKEYGIELKNSIIKTQLEDISLSLEIIESLIDSDISLENKIKMDELSKKILRTKQLMLKDNELTKKNKFKITILYNQYHNLLELKKQT
ncbi:hypothetical protein ACWOAH_01565 [Vagococcus vulneris]|uniref:RepB-like DNA primase domain-containing protein n=1 Tax=Vagococcus vulneris TaxID=1977869 RepID=A0A430A1M6_9ENTE|nr:hypothetical protein [Vagococcus vulneris]RSU00239.1 hypothetical protein CBF37_02780 [Vagococcus vulneris]